MSDLTIGSIVKHPAHRETGVVTEICRDVWTRELTVCWVEFPHRTWVQKSLCRARDLTVVGQQPALRVVEA